VISIAKCEKLGSLLAPSARPSIYEKHHQAKITRLKDIRDSVSHAIISTVRHEANVENVEILRRLVALTLPRD